MSQDIALPAVRACGYRWQVDVEEQLLRIAGEAAAAWPTLRLTAAEFITHLRARIDGETTAKGASEALSKLHATDLYLACACLEGDDAAWRELDRHHLSRVGQFVGRIDPSPAFCDDVRQRLGEKLLPSANEQGKLELYTGRGPLGAWLRVAAIREAQSGKRRKKKTVDVDDVPLASKDLDPEIQLLKRRYAKEFGDAFKSVLVTLSADERNVLRLHYLDGLTIEEVGTTYRVSRATAARWIASARQTIIERTQAALGDRLGASAPHAQSMLALVQSQLDLSIRRHFKP